MNCEEARAQLHAYVDQEVPARGLLVLEEHLMVCAACRREYEALRSVVDSVRGARPLYEPPEGLSARVKEKVEAGGLRSWVRAAWRPAAVAAGICLVVVLALHVARQPAVSFSIYAADTHLRYARGLMPLDVSSSDSEVVSAWLGGRVPFHLTLPDFPGNEKPYALRGARLVQYHEQDVVYLAYEMDRRPISLLIASSERVRPSHGEVRRLGGLAFHVSSVKGLSLITWSDQGLTYALVSDVATGAAESCVICHGSAAERSKFESLHRSR